MRSCSVAPHALPDPSLKNTFKGTQIGIAATTPSPPARIPAANLTALNCGSIRVIISSYAQSDYDALEVYLKTLRAAGLFVICCMDMAGSLTQVQWKQRVSDWVSTCRANVYELGNEEGATFNYAGGAGTNWSKYFDAIEDASRIIYGMGRKPILGAAIDVSTNALLDAAKAPGRWGTTRAGWPVDGVAVHPYGQASSTYSRAAALTQVQTRLLGARNRIPDIPIYGTEMGWGSSGNVNSTLVANEDSVQAIMDLGSTTASAGNPNMPTGTITVASTSGFASSGKILIAGTDLVTYTGITGTTFTGCTGGSGAIATGATVKGAVSYPTGTLKVGTTAAFPSTGSLFTFDTQKFTYTGKTATSFTGCSGGNAATIDDLTALSLWLPDNSTRENEQAALITAIYAALWPRRVKSDLYLASIGQFICVDYGSAPDGNWANQSGLLDSTVSAWSGAGYTSAQRPAFAAFAAEDLSRVLT